ncbi:MAG TPA: hypothetical protein VK348_15435, partial [Planctomycetota bacterium]|nr:hypothetical protein [Planctomycetota bacterium]
VHALGVLLYEMLTGRSPFAGSNLFQALKLVESLLPPPPSSLRESVPPPIDALVLRALAKEPGERPASAAEFATALAAAVVNAAPQPAGPAAVIGRLRQLWPVHLLLASLLLLGAVLLLLQGSLPPLPAPTLALDAEARATAARTIHDTLRQTHLRPDQLELLRAAIRQLDDASSAREQFARGRAELRLGACAAALSDLDAALRGGVAEARDLAAVAWLGMHVLLPATVAAPAWLLPGDCRRRDRIFATGTGTDGPAVNGSRLWTAASQLAAGDARAAWNTVHAEQGRAVDLEPMAEALVALLSARQLCAEDAAFARIAAGLSANLPDWPLLELLGRQSTAARARSFADAIAQLAPETPDRWLLELLRTFDAALRGSTPDALLSAPAELAWLTGAGPAALVWHAALQLQLAQRSPAHAVEAATAGSLLSLLQGQDAGDWPAVVPARALLSLADSGIAAAEAVLAVLPATPAPPLAMFACWRDAVGKGGAPLQLARGTAWFLLARSDQARSCLDRCEQAEPEVRAGAHFLRALLQDTPVPLAPAEVAAVPAAVLAVAAAPAWPARADALAGLVEHLLGAGAEPRSLLPLLRAAAIAGADVAALLAGSLRVFEDGGLHAAYLQEVCGGIH